MADPRIAPETPIASGREHVQLQNSREVQMLLVAHADQHLHGLELSPPTLPRSTAVTQGDAGAPSS